MTISNLVFETLVTEAARQVSHYTRTGLALNEAIKQVADDLDMTNEEREALEERAKKSLVGNAPVASEEDLLAVDSHPTAGPDNCLKFDSEDDLDAAAGVLMYKGCPWKTKDRGELLLEFDDRESLQQAQSILKRRFDFVEAAPRRVGMVEFDNLADYSKVLEFMKRQGMMLEKAETGDLEEDAELQEALSAPVEGFENQLPATPAVRTFAARTRGSAPLGEADVFGDPSCRAVRVRKRWK